MAKKRVATKDESSARARCGYCKESVPLDFPNSEHRYIFEIIPITFEVRSHLKVPFNSDEAVRVRIPDQYKALIYPGYGSQLDGSLVFLTEDQMSKLSKYVCEKCFWSIFNGQTFGTMEYFEFPPRLIEEKLEKFEDTELTGKIIPFRKK